MELSKYAIEECLKRGITNYQDKSKTCIKCGSTESTGTIIDNYGMCKLCSQIDRNKKTTKEEV